jgi:broad specificity phosphatase PhoE
MEAVIDNFEKMLENHRNHLNRLKRWKQAGGELKNYPEGESLDDFIKREEAAIENIERAMTRLKE